MKNQLNEEETRLVLMSLGSVINKPRVGYTQNEQEAMVALKKRLTPEKYTVEYNGNEAKLHDLTPKTLDDSIRQALMHTLLKRKGVSIMLNGQAHIATGTLNRVVRDAIEEIVGCAPVPFE